MILILEADAPASYYLQIYRQIVDAVADGRLQAGEALPSTRQLAGDLGVNYHTVHRAYQLLLSSGLISMAPRKRAVVNPPDRRAPSREWMQQWAAQVSALLGEAQAVGLASADIQNHLDAALARL